MIIKLSIITVCLNEVKNIERTMHSIVNQTWQDFEWIVVDGGSTDGTLEIIEKYRNHINVLISEKDTGIYNAMNKGILKAKGEYCLFLNAGDHFYSHSKLTEIFNNHILTSDIIFGRIQYIKDEIKTIHVPFETVTLENLYRTTIPHSASLIKRELFLRKNGLYDENFKIVSDYDFYLKAFIKFKATFQFIDLILTTFYLDGVSITQMDLHNKEREILKSRYFNYFHYLWFIKKWNVKYNHFIMLLTHPRYIAGWVKKIIICRWKKNSR